MTVTIKHLSKSKAILALMKNHNRLLPKGKKDKLRLQVLLYPSVAGEKEECRKGDSINRGWSSLKQKVKCNSFKTRIKPTLLASSVNNRPNSKIKSACF